MQTRILATLVVTLFLSGCWFSSSEPAQQPQPQPQPATETIGGTAAIGAPLAEATVTLRCATGSYTAQTGQDGTWTVEVPEGAAPCLIRATSDDPAVEIYSFAREAGTANITPLTSIAAARAAMLATGNVDIAAVFALGTLDLGAIDDEMPGTISDLLNDLTLAGYTLPDDFEPFTGAFEASPGDEYDDLLEVFAAALTNSGQTLEAFIAAYLGNAPFPPAAGDGSDVPFGGGCGAVGVQPRPTGATLLGTCARTFVVTGTATDPPGRGEASDAYVRGTIIIHANGDVDLDDDISFTAAEINTVFDHTAQSVDRRVQVNFDEDDSGRRLDIYVDEFGIVTEILYSAPGILLRAIIQPYVLAEDDDEDPDTGPGDGGDNPGPLDPTLHARAGLQGLPVGPLGGLGDGEGDFGWGVLWEDSAPVASLILVNPGEAPVDYSAGDIEIQGSDRALTRPISTGSGTIARGRCLAEPVSSNDGVYFSFLVRLEHGFLGAAGNNVVSAGGAIGVTATNNRHPFISVTLTGHPGIGAFTGQGLTVTGQFSDSFGFFAADEVAMSRDTYLVVMHLYNDPSDDGGFNRMDVWINPDSATAPPMPDIQVADSHYANPTALQCVDFGLGIARGLNYDEFRFANDWAKLFSNPD